MSKTMSICFFLLKADKNEEIDSKDSFVETETESFQNENTFSCSKQEQTQPGESFSNPEVESDNLSESDCFVMVVGSFQLKNAFSETGYPAFYQ